MLSPLPSFEFLALLGPVALSQAQARGRFIVDKLDVMGPPTCVPT